MNRHRAFGLFLASVLASVSVILVGSPVGAETSSANATCIKALRVWYDQDQFGSYPKAWGEIRDCNGPRQIAVSVTCKGKVVYSVSAASARLAKGSTSTPLGYIGTCSEPFLGRIFGNVAGAAFEDYFRWGNGGYPA